MIKEQADTPLVVINQLNPIYVTFTVPEATLAEIRRHSANGKLRVQAIPQGGTDPEIGTLAFIDNAVDQATGTIRLKAAFSNERHRLWPGQFVNVVMTLATQKNAVLVPTAAVQAGQKGSMFWWSIPNPPPASGWSPSVLWSATTRPLPAALPQAIA